MDYLIERAGFYTGFFLLIAIRYVMNGLGGYRYFRKAGLRPWLAWIPWASRAARFKASWGNAGFVALSFIPFVRIVAHFMSARKMRRSLEGARMRFAAMYVFLPHIAMLVAGYGGKGYAGAHRRGKASGMPGRTERKTAVIVAAVLCSAGYLLYTGYTAGQSFRRSIALDLKAMVEETTWITDVSAHQTLNGCTVTAQDGNGGTLWIYVMAGRRAVRNPYEKSVERAYELADGAREVYEGSDGGYLRLGYWDAEGGNYNMLTVRANTYTAVMLDDYDPDAEPSPLLNFLTEWDPGFDTSAAVSGTEGAVDAGDGENGAGRAYAEDGAEAGMPEGLDPSTFRSARMYGETTDYKFFDFFNSDEEWADIVSDALGNAVYEKNIDSVYEGAGGVFPLYVYIDLYVDSYRSIKWEIEYRGTDYVNEIVLYPPSYKFNAEDANSRIYYELTGEEIENLPEMLADMYQAS